MNRKITALITSATVALGLTVAGLAAAAPADAHTPTVQADCQALTVNLTNYAAPTDAVYKDVKVIDTPAQPAVAEVSHTVTIIDTAAVPAIPAVPAVTHTEYEFKHFLTGKTRWETNPNWNANGNPNSIGWFSTGKTQVIIDKAAIPAVPAVPAVTHDEKVIDTPATAAVDEVSHIEHQLVSDATTNHVTVTDNGASRADTDFPTSYSEVFPSTDQTIAHDYVVTVESSDGYGAGTWTKHVDACVIVVQGAPTLTVAPPTCEHPYNVVSYDIPAGLSIAGYTGKGSVTAEDLNLGYGDKTYAVDVAKGYQYDGPTSVTITLTAPPTDAECAGEQPEAKVTYSDWETGEYGCGDTTVTMTRTVTVTPYVLDGREWVLDTENAETSSQTETRNLTGAEIEALNCPVVVVPPVTPPTTTPAPQPPVKAAAVAPTKTFVTDTSDTLAQTGTNEDFGGIGAVAGIIIVLGLLAAIGAGVRSRRKAAQK